MAVIEEVVSSSSNSHGGPSPSPSLSAAAARVLSSGSFVTTTVLEDAVAASPAPLVGPPPAELPSGRGGHAACTAPLPADAREGEDVCCVVFGGANREPTVFDDVWRLVGNSSTGAFRWKRVVAPPLTNDDGVQHAPSARSGASASLVGKHVYVFGGQDPASGMVFNDVHALDTETGGWQRIEPASQSPPPMHSHACGVLRGRCLLVFGGASPNGVHADVYVFDTETRTWTNAKVSADDGVRVPAPREMHSGIMADDCTMVVYGGRGADGAVLDDAAVLDASDGAKFMWRRRRRTGHARCAHASAAAFGGSAALVHGGFTGSAVAANPELLDVASLSLRTAAPAHERADIPRFAHAAAAADLSSSSAVVLFGGVTPEEDLADVLLWTAS